MPTTLPSFDDPESGAGEHPEQADGAGFATASRGAAAMQANALTQTNGPMPTPRILIVDDDTYVHVGVRAAIRALRADVRTASTGREALSVASSFHPDIAILDVGLPDTDGYQLAYDLRSDPALAGLRIIFLTGYLPDRLSVDVAGGNVFLGKPYRMKVLLDAVRRELGATRVAG